jgi:hypothetical protein
MTERDYVAKCEGFKLAEAKEWERTRLINFFQFNSMTTKAILNPKQLYRIPLIDGKDITMTTEEKDELFKMLTPK